MQALSIGDAAQQLGVTLRRWKKAGRLSADFRTPGQHRRYRLDTLLTLFSEQDPAAKLTLAYARVSCADQRRQAERLQQTCQRFQDGPVEVIRDLGSGLNCKKKGLLKLLPLICRGQVGRLVIENPDRLLRFGWSDISAELVFALCKTFGLEVVITVMSARRYGQRSHARRRARMAA